MGFLFADVNGRTALVSDDHHTDLATHSSGALGPDPMETLARPDLLAELAALPYGSSVTGLPADVVVGPPVRRPQKVFGIGLHHQDHADEGGVGPPASPLMFTRFPACLDGPTADVEIRSGGVDHEGELVVVIGQGGRDITIDDAWNHVIGVTMGQDISDCPAQFVAEPPHFDFGKSFDTFGPIGGDERGDRRQETHERRHVDQVGGGAVLADFAVDRTIDGTMTNRIVRISDPRPIRG